jgi:hypothetical protein
MVSNLGSSGNESHFGKQDKLMETRKSVPFSPEVNFVADTVALSQLGLQARERYP